MGRCHVTQGNGAPATAPMGVGDHYTDTSTGDIYLSNGTASPANWVIQAISADVKVKVSSNDTTPGFLVDKLVVADETNTTNALELKEVNDGGDEGLKIAFDESKITITESQISDLSHTVNTDTQIIIQDEGSTLTTAATKINFVGAGVTVTQPVTDEVLVTIPDNTPVFGSYHQEVSSEGVSSTTSGSYQTKLTLTTPNLPVGKYRVGFTFLSGINQNGTLADYQVRNNTTQIAFMDFESDNDRHIHGGFRYLNISGVNTFDIRYRSENSGDGPTTIAQARIEFWRIS